MHGKTLHDRPGWHATILVAAAMIGLALSSGAFAEPKAEEGKPLWSFVWITDTEGHWQAGGGEYIPALLNKVAECKPKLVIHTGDTSFEWGNRGSWKDVLEFVRAETPPIEFHLAPGNHDDEHGQTLRPFLAKAASQGIYPLDTGQRVEDKGYYKDHKIEEVSGPEWPIWNPEIVQNPKWRPEGGFPGRYAFKRGGIRFIVLDFEQNDEYLKWLGDFIRQPDDSSISIILQHKTRQHFPDQDDGPHNVKLVLSGHLQGYKKAEGKGVTFMRGAGIGNSDHGENDAMVAWVYADHLRMDRYVIRQGHPVTDIEGPIPIWTCPGHFTEYRRPQMPHPASEATTQPAGGASGHVGKR